MWSNTSFLFACRNTSFGGQYEEEGYYYLANFNDLFHSYGKSMNSFGKTNGVAKRSLALEQTLVKEFQD